ncbi:MAG: hypothetical protein ACTHKT_02185 [Solirubrobacterales bacterium]
MQAQGISEHADALEEAVLRHILGWQPTILRQCDLVRELAKEPSDFNSRNAVEEATRNLVEAGLLHRQGECVLPTVTLVYVHGMDIG